MITLQQGTIYLGTAAPASGGGGSGDAVWGSITGTLSNQTDLATALAGKQDTLTAGTGIDITNNVISATGGATSVENKNTAVGATNPLNFWEGTSAEFNTGGGSQTWYNWQSGAASWVQETSGVSVQLNAGAYGNGKFVAVGNGGTIISSSDGETWTTETSGVSSNLNDVIYANNEFMAVGDNGTILTSSNGSTWTSQTITGSPKLYCVAYGNGLYVILAESGDFYSISSSDGSTWSNGGSCTSVMPTGIAFGNNTFVIVDNGTYAINYSTDGGATWTYKRIMLGAVDIVFGDGKFIALGDYGAKSSTDGTTWTNISVIVGNGNKSIIYADNKFYILGTNGGLLSSSDGSTWSEEIAAGYYNRLTALTYGNGVFVAMGDSGIVISYDSTAPLLSCFTTDSAPTTSSQVYSAPNTTSALTITAVGTGTITLSDTNTYNYNASGNQTTSQSVGEAHPDWICMIEGVGIKKGSTTIA